MFQRNGFSPTSLFTNKNFVLLWGGQTISLLGDFLFETTLILWVTFHLARGQSWAPIAVGGVYIAMALPRFVFGPIAGVFADRWNKRRTMLLMDLVRMLLIVIVAGMVILVSGPMENEQTPRRLLILGILYAGIIGVGICSQLFFPSRLALMSDIVERSQQPVASSMLQISLALAAIIGPALASTLYFIIGPFPALLCNAASFFLSFLALCVIRLSTSQQPEQADLRSFSEDFLEGLSFLRQSTLLHTVLSVLIFIVLGTSILESLSIFFLLENLHSSSTIYGLLLSFFSLGSILGALIAGFYTRHLSKIHILLLSVFGWGILTLLLSRVTTLVPALLLLALIGIVNAIASVTLEPFILEHVPKELVGRIRSLYMPLFNLISTIAVGVASLLLGTVLQGFQIAFLNVVLGPVDTIFMSVALFAIVGSILAALRLNSSKLMGSLFTLKEHDLITSPPTVRQKGK